MSPWSQFYAGRTGDDYGDYARDKYGPFLDTLRNVARPMDRFLELGCGLGTITRLLGEQLQFASVVLTATDNDSEMLRLARENLPGWVDVDHHDARFGYYSHPDIVHSHGLLEHFPDEQIRQIITAHSYARVQVHYVPSWLYEKPSFGDERLMFMDHWHYICKPCDILSFNNGFDYAIIIER